MDSIQQIKAQFETEKELWAKDKELYEINIEQLKQKVMIRDREILHLSQKLSEITAQNKVLDEKAKKIQLIMRTKNQSINNKNIEITNMETKLKEIEVIHRQTMNSNIQELVQIINHQEKELADMMGDHERMVSTFQQVSDQNALQQQEKQLLTQFNEQLQKQVEDVQNINEDLLKTLTKYERELKLQNDQGNDLICQVETIVEEVEQIK